MKNNLPVFDLREEGLRLLSRSAQYEGAFTAVHAGLAHFQELQETLRGHFADIKRTQTALERAQAKAQETAAFVAPPLPATPPTESLTAAPLVRGETSRQEYQAALNDQDVITALLRLHNETEIETRMKERGIAIAETPDASQALAPAAMRETPIEKMRFSRINQSSRGIFSPVLKPNPTEPQSS